MPNLNLCDPSKYYSTPYISDNSTDQLNRVPSSNQDINIIQTLDTDAILDLNSLSDCELQNISSITVNFTTNVKGQPPALVINGGDPVIVETRSGELDPWVINHEKYFFPETYSIDSIESKNYTKIDGIFNNSEIKTQTLDIIGDGSLAGSLINSRFVNILGHLNYVQGANISCSDLEIISNKARIDRSSILCNTYTQKGPDASLLDCNIIAASAILETGYILNSQFTFSEINLKGGKTNSTFIYDPSISTTSPFSGVEFFLDIQGQPSFISSGNYPMMIENTETNEKFNTEVPLLVINGNTPINGSIKTILMSGQTPDITIGALGNITTDYLSAANFFNSGNTTIEHINAFQRTSINNYGKINLNNIDANNKTFYLNKFFGEMFFSQDTVVLHSFHNEPSGKIVANNLQNKITSSNSGELQITNTITVTGNFTNKGSITAKECNLFESASNGGLIKATDIILSGAYNASGGFLIGNAEFLKDSWNEGEANTPSFLYNARNNGRCQDASFKMDSQNNYWCYGVADFYHYAVNNGGGSTLIFHDLSQNFGGDVDSGPLAEELEWQFLYFFDNSTNNADLTGRYNSNGASGLLAGSVMFHHNSINRGLIPGGQTYAAPDGYSFLRAYFRDYSYNTHTVTSGSFLDNSTNWGRAIDCVFSDNSISTGNSYVSNCVFLDNSANITMAEECKFYGSSQNLYPEQSKKLSFYDNSLNRGRVDEASFFDTKNYGQIETLAFFSGSSAVNYGLINAESIGFVNNAINLAEINGENIRFWDQSCNRSTINCDNSLEFLNASYNDIPGDINCNDVSLLNQSYNNGKITSSSTTIENSQNNGSIVSNDLVFRDDSINMGYINANVARFTYRSINRGSIMGDAVFLLNSINEGTITGNVAFDESSVNLGTIIGEIRIV